MVLQYILSAWKSTLFLWRNTLGKPYFGIKCSELMQYNTAKNVRACVSLDCNPIDINERINDATHTFSIVGYRLMFHSCSLVLHSCSLLLHSCSIRFHSCFIRALSCFVPVHSCSICVHPYSICAGSWSCSIPICSCSDDMIYSCFTYEYISFLSWPQSPPHPDHINCVYCAQSMRK